MEDQQNGFKRPFPALTPAQRYHFDVFGYVVIENTLTEDLTGRLLEALQRLKRDFLDTSDPIRATIRGSRVTGFSPYNVKFTHILETDPAILEYIAHPRLVGMAEEVVGDTVRLEESEAIVNSRNPDEDFEGQPRYGFHIGVRPDIGTYVENGLLHSNFVKTLTNLTDIEGPDDGGTVAIAGSHKMKCSQEEIVACAYDDPSLIHHVVAPAGSTLLFTEALIHATGQKRSDGERAIIIAGYTPTHFQAWMGNEPSEGFVEQTAEPLRPLISGSGSGIGSTASGASGTPWNPGQDRKSEAHSSIQMFLICDDKVPLDDPGALCYAVLIWRRRADSG